ncbi:MAG: DUF4846 domain-containing protein [Myxococcales bacterium]|nr:DUF4846 domain-containing protein [Myxococcales bacterium]
MMASVTWVIGLAIVPWPTHSASRTLPERLVPPVGYQRVHLSPTSFGAWLRKLSVKPGRPDVHLYNGRKKHNQSAHWLVLDIDVGKRDLQQCADAVMRLFAEWQWDGEQFDRICFRYTSGHKVSWSDWSLGYRPKIRGRSVILRRRGVPDARYRAFRAYLNSIFMYAGTASMARDLVPVVDPLEVQPGDVFIQGGNPGHAVLVVDVVENESSQRRLALVQSYMPAQEIHVLRNPKADGPWYNVGDVNRPLKTPEWTFSWLDLKRFSETGCP